MRALIVDEGAAARSALRDLLARCRQPVRDVREAADTMAGVRDFVDHPPDLAFVDLLAPGEYGGLVACQFMLEERPAARVVATGALSPSHVDVLAAKSLGVLDYLRKPATLASVQACLDRAEELAGRFDRIR